MQKATRMCKVMVQECFVYVSYLYFSPQLCLILLSLQSGVLCSSVHLEDNSLDTVPEFLHYFHSRYQPKPEFLSKKDNIIDLVWSGVYPGPVNSGQWIKVPLLRLN